MYILFFYIVAIFIFVLHVKNPLICGNNVFFMVCLLLIDSTKFVDDAPPSSLMDLIENPKVKATTKAEGVRVRSLAHNTLRVEGCVGASGWGLGRLSSNLVTHIYMHKPNNKLIGA